MQIIIVGCGKVGKTLAAHLSREDHNVTIIDTNAEKIREAANVYDIMGVVGNGTSYEVLQEADIRGTDILIAVTYSDEVNLLCCVLARRFSECKTIARVRNPIYLSDRAYIQKALGLSMTINPEYAAAREISRLLRFPTAIDISSFSNGRIEMYRFKTPAAGPLVGRAVKDVPLLRRDVLVCCLERDGQVAIPDGSTCIKAGDVLSVVLPPDRASDFFHRIGFQTNAAKNAMIVGCSETAYYLAQMLTKTGIGVKIIERDRARCEELCEKLPAAAIIHADGSDEEVLREEHLSDMDALIASTGIDEENIILSLYAMNKVKKKVITKISHLDFNEVIASLSLDSIVNPKRITAESILRYVRAMAGSAGSNVERLYKLADGRVEALEFTIKSGSRLTHIPFRDLRLKPGTLVAGIIRHGHFVIPGGEDTLMPGDSAVVVTTNSGFRDIADMLLN